MTDVHSAAFTLARRGLDLRFRSAVLARRDWVTDAYVRVRVEGDDLRGFASLGCDDHMRLFFPGGPVDTVEQMRAAPSREYTPLAWGEGWLDVEFAIHGAEGERGVAAEWAASAPLGAPVGVGGPRGSMVLEGTPDAWFLAGDETAVPAMRRFAASMPADAVGTVLIEVPDAAHELTIDAPAGVSVSYVHRGDAVGGTALVARLDAMDAADRPGRDVFAFIAAEQAVVRPGRALAVERWGLDPARIVVKGYWKRGDAAFHAPH
ncbi:MULTISPECIES: siderophore-interacting protein [Microbacterium]|uniref:Siderophore-interacting protein n=1 Tax=Microbacterium wangchenii TaxID=2541726 RepID=A0ABX5SQV5_9MICO|nr:MULTISPECIES: siderophore-interacting protein [Microbacterium]MCK6065068.1 siderophore-interacting protein [Microbacterium sp. EYE_512]QBR88531.1 siderophore-interacting protein [Microbacterium wangchenii]